MPFEVGDEVDLITGQTIPEGKYTVVRVEGRRVTIRDSDGKQLVVDERKLSGFVRKGPNE